MGRRNYLDLTPTEMAARRYVVWGLGLFTMPPLLTSCHLAQFLCRASWHSGIAPFLALWGVFPWMLPVALVMLGGLAMAALGGVLLFRERRFRRRTRQEVCCDSTSLCSCDVSVAIRTAAATPKPSML